MAEPRILVLRAPGTNCDAEAAYAFERAGGRAELAHVNRLLESPGDLARFQAICIPGGFSYGDDVAAGRIFGNQLRNHLRGPLEEFKAAGKLILGICNGFQILIKSGLLLADRPSGLPPATLAWNDSGRFEDRWVHLRVTSAKSVFFTGIERLELPIAHAEGKFVACDGAQLATLDRAGQLVLRYARAGDASENVNEPAPYPVNPNGAEGNVAGVCDETGRVCGLMPHPERFIDPLQHPRWTRGPQRTTSDGFRVFENAVNYFR